MTKIKETPVKNHAGISKRFQLDEETGTYKDTGKFRAIRRTCVDGYSKKEQGVFDSLEEAKSFRAGKTDKVPLGNSVHRQSIDKIDSLSFETLVEEWKAFHYLTLEPSTQQTYDKRLPNLDFLKKYPVKQIIPNVVDELVKYWVKSHPKTEQRFTFEKELNLLKVILNFHRKRNDRNYAIPVFEEHYTAADIAKAAQKPVVSLSKDELIGFLEELRQSKTPFYPLALAQFCLGLRIGEVCGMTWEAVDLEKGVARIEWTIVWDQYSWAPRVKKRPKNGKVRFLVLPEILKVELKRPKAVRDPKVPFIFHKNGTPFNRQSVAKAYNRALERLGISHVRGTHMLRKTSATLANEVTGDFYAVSRLMDHSSPDVTRRYVAPTDSQKEKVASALNSVLAEALENKGSGRKKLEPVPLCPLTEDPRSQNSIISTF